MLISPPQCDQPLFAQDSQLLTVFPRNAVWYPARATHPPTVWFMFDLGLLAPHQVLIEGLSEFIK